MGPRSIPSESETGQALDMPTFSHQGSSNTPAQAPPSSTPIELSEMAKAQADPGSTSSGVEIDDHTTTRDTEEFRQRQDGQANAPVFPQPQTGFNESLKDPNSISVLPHLDDPMNTTSASPIREVTRPAIGAATDRPSPTAKEMEIEEPVLHITLLLTTGARHPFRLDQKYLRKRNVEVEGNSPVNMSLYKLKELILRDWREGMSSALPISY